MHYYQWNIADYRKDTGHLTLVEHGIYRQLLDTYYLNEKPIETQLVIRRLKIITKEELAAFEDVVSDFFTKSDCGEYLIHGRADNEISNYQARAETARANGGKGGRPKKPRKTQPVNSGKAKKTQSKANQEPITNNHKPITNKKLTKKKSSPPAPDFSILEMTDDEIAEVKRIRKKNQGGAITQRVVNALAKEFGQAKTQGFTIDAILTEWEMRGWKGFKAEWLSQAARASPKAESYIDKVYTSSPEPEWMRN